MKEIDSLLFLAIQVSVLAGREIIKVYDADFSVEKKKDNSPLTLADRKSHATIFNILSETGIPILSEEGKEIPYLKRKNWKRLWIVDPLDGTKEFIKRNDEFTVNIALIENNTPVIGVIYVPVKQTLYFSGKNNGAYKIPNLIDFHFSDSKALISKSYKLPLQMQRGKFTIVTSRSHMTEETVDYIAHLKKKHQKIDLISAGSSMKICLVAEGFADVYPRFGPTMEWDTAAGQAIAENAGKIIMDIKTNQPMTYNKENLINNSFIVQ